MDQGDRVNAQAPQKFITVVAKKKRMLPNLCIEGDLGREPLGLEYPFIGLGLRNTRFKINIEQSGKVGLN